MISDFNFYLIFLGSTIVLNFILGSFILYKNFKSISSKLLFFFCSSNSLWALASYLSYSQRGSISDDILIYIVRSVLLFAMMQSLSFYLLMKAFPEEKKSFNNLDKYVIIPWAAVVSLVSFTGLFFKGFVIVENQTRVDISSFIGIFGITSTFLVGLGIYEIYRKFKSKNGEKFKSLILGVVLMFSSIILFNFIMPVFMGEEKFTPASTIFTLPFVFLTFYGITQNKMLANVKVVTTELAMVSLWAFTFVRMFMESTISEVVANVLLFLVVLFFGVVLIRSVNKEIDEKEKVLQLNKKISQQNKKIELQKTSLEQLLKVKDETLHIVNHQLNTPISVIRSAVSMFQDKLWAEDRFLGVVNTELKRISETIAQFLAAKKAEDGFMILNKVKTDLGTLVKSLIDEKRLLKKVRETNIKIDFQEVAVPPVLCDVSKITEVISNLLDNAINYSSKDISVRLESDKKQVLLSVKDSGIGIPKESIKNLFQRFTRLDNAKKTRPDGTGLGLYVCKQIVEVHNGKIWVESEGEGNGSTFFVSLPIINS